MRHWAIGLIAGASLLVAACSQENPSASSSDDTHSIGRPTNAEEIITPLTSLSTETIATEVESQTLDTSPTVPESKSGEVVANSVVNNQTSTTVQLVAAANSSIPVVSSAPSQTRPAPTIAPECDVMPLANCQNVDLRGLDLFYANFQGANLSGANLSGMDLTGADFTGANLTGANLIGATLDYGFFFETNLTGAKLSRASMESIVWDDTTIWPTGFAPPDY